MIAPDWFGFGRSDKPLDDAIYTWDFHRESLLRFIEALELTDITLVVQDWGGLLGLTVPADMADRVSGLLIMNTAFGVGQTPSQGWTDWKEYVARTPDLAVGKLMGRSCTHLSEAEVAAYDAPFPDVSYKAGVRTFPSLVPYLPTWMESASPRPQDPGGQRNSTVTLSWPLAPMTRCWPQ